MLRKILLAGSNSDYFGIYDNALSKEECNIIIDSFEKSEYSLGYMGSGYRPEHKKCMQMVYSFPNINPVSNILKVRLKNCIEKYKIEQPQLEHMQYWATDDNYNIQKYETKDDGYKRWHCEHDTVNPKRIMAWMFYLNDAKSGTEFMNYPTIQPKMGRCVIWPAFWTHTHRGVTPNKGLKYIATGWISLC